MHHNGTLDYARLLAAFGIVFFHAGAPGAGIGYAALPFFLLLLVVLSFGGATRMSLSDYVRSRAQRLLIPWLIWSGVYGVLKLAELALIGAPIGSEFSPYMLLTGPALHLWFLPFAFVVCAFIYPLVRLTHHISPKNLAVILASSGLAILWLQQGAILSMPFAQWVYALPSVAVGMALGLVWGRLMAMLLICGGFSIAALLSEAHMGLLQIVLAGGALILCTLCPLPATRHAQLAGSLSLGVYLAHPLILSVLGRITPLPHDSLSMALLGCAGGLAIAFGAYLLSQVHIPTRLTAPNAQNTIS